MPEMSVRVTLVALPDVRNGRAAAVGHRRRTHHTASLVPYVLAVLLSTPLSLAANGAPAHAADSREQRPAPAADGARLAGLGGEFGEFGEFGAPGWYGTGHPQPDAGPHPDSDPEGIAARSLRPDDRAARLTDKGPLDEEPLDERSLRASGQTPRRHGTGSHVRAGTAPDRTHEPERRPHARKSTPPRHHPRLRPARGRRQPAQAQATTPPRKPTGVRAPAPRTAPAPAAPEPSPPRTDDGDGDVASGSSRQLPPVQPPPVPPPLLPWGAGLASIGLGLALFAVRLRR